MEQLKPIKELNLKHNTLYRFIFPNGGDKFVKCFLDETEGFFFVAPHLTKKHKKIEVCNGNIKDVMTHFQEMELIEPELGPLIKHPINLYKESMGWVVVYDKEGSCPARHSNGKFYHYGSEKDSFEISNITHFMIIPND